MVRVRIAPSPTGIPHIGNTRTALFNYLFAKHNKGRFILRIEDTDRKRIIPGAKEAIIEILNWLELVPDETYIQSERLGLYREVLEFLLKNKFAREDEGAIRFIVPKDVENVEWVDAVGNKKISFKTKDIEDFVIFKSDGFPTYHLASVVDDKRMDISHVIRGEEWISSTPKHLLLYKALGWQHPKFAHLPVILGQDKSKLSKRHGAESVLDYQKKGYLKDAILNYIALLGWNPGGDKELMSLSEMIRLFDLPDVNTANPIFDLQKFTWMNGQYIRSSNNESLKTLLSDFYKNEKEVLAFIKRDQNFDVILDLAKSRMKTLGEFKNLVVPQSPQLSSNEKNIASDILKKFSSLKNWTEDSILNVIREVLKEHKVKGSILYKIITGFEKGLPLPSMLATLGKEEVIRRIKKII